MRRAGSSDDADGADCRGPAKRCRDVLPWQLISPGCSSLMVRQKSAGAFAAAAAAAHRARAGSSECAERRRRKRKPRREGGERGSGIQQLGGKAA